MRTRTFKIYRKALRKQDNNSKIVEDKWKSGTDSCISRHNIRTGWICNYMIAFCKVSLGRSHKKKCDRKRPYRGAPHPDETAVQYRERSGVLSRARPLTYVLMGHQGAALKVTGGHVDGTTPPVEVGNSGTGRWSSFYRHTLNSENY
ncbi:hypothetical protein NQ317_004759 [Molorchus minor]|uniref:Uncharacterized protein n=1 Tax=Molorchus minor TaxID=1323400 RepID=A0ABQ9JFH4_9CUCU|nr:hypothetical protein NQ317_004759 [Molorchus minor]